MAAVKPFVFIYISLALFVLSIAETSFCPFNGSCIYFVTNFIVSCHDLFTFASFVSFFVWLCCMLCAAVSAWLRCRSQWQSPPSFVAFIFIALCRLVVDIFFYLCFICIAIAKIIMEDVCPTFFYTKVKLGLELANPYLVDWKMVKGMV